MPFVSFLVSFLASIEQFVSNLLSGFWRFVLETGQYSIPRISWEIFASGGWVIFLIVFLWGAWQVWVYHIQGKFASRIKWILLSVSAPRYNELSPETAERMFAHLAGAYKKGNLVDRYIHGYFQTSFSFEIVSLGGRIQYFIRTPLHFRDLVESAVYGAYPDAEISEAPEDYTKGAPKEFPNESYDLWGTELTLYNDECYPIRTYPSFEYPSLKEFVDPLASFLEILGKISPEEQIWFQIIITPISSDWKKKGEKLVEKLMAEKTGFAPAEEREEMVPVAVLSPGDRRVIESIQLKISKIGFRTKIRLIYLAPKECFSKARGVSGPIGALHQFNTLNMNGFKPDPKTKTTIDYFLVKKRVAWRQNKIIRNYIARSAWAGMTSFVLNIEELASLYHFPLRTLKAPTIKKTSTRKGAPPPNLPLET